MKGSVLSYSMVSADRYGGRSRFEKLSVWHSATLEFFGHELLIDVKSGGERIGMEQDIGVVLPHIAPWLTVGN